VTRRLAWTLLGLTGLLALQPQGQAQSYFEWQLEFYREGIFGTAEVLRIIEDGPIFEGQGWACRVEKSWKDSTGWMMIEGKTLTCERQDVARSVSVICNWHDSHVENFERHPEAQGLYLNPQDPRNTPFLKLGCQTGVRRLAPLQLRKSLP
jgi:hypothetical protein